MLDKITINIKDENGYLQKIIQSLPEYRNERSVKGAIGKFDGLTIIKKHDTLVIYGSVTKYGYGSNIFNADISKTIQFTRSIISKLSLPLNNKVNEIEFGFNIPVEKQPLTYLNDFSHAETYNRVMKAKNKEVVYIKDGKKMRFYDKTEHFERDRHLLFGQDIPAINLLRYEMVLINPMNPFNAKLPFIISDLYDRDVLNAFIFQWRDEFNKIISRPHVIADFNPDTPTDYFQHLILKGVESYGGIDTFFDNDTVSFPNNNIAYRKRVRDRLRRILKNNTLTKCSDTFNELRQKINFFALHYNAKQ